MVNLSQDSIDEFRVRTALESALIQLDASWLILGDLRLDGPNQAAAADYAVLNPQYGVALIDVVHRRTGEPEQRLRRFLNERGFAGRFPGALPIVRLVLTQCDAASLERQLRAAFGQATPIGIADPDWVAAINALLAPATAATTRPGFPPFRRPTPRRRDAPERDATQQADESWNVAPEAPPKPEAQPKPETQPTTASRAARAKSAPETSSPAPQPPAPERQRMAQRSPRPTRKAADGAPNRAAKLRFPMSRLRASRSSR